MNMEGIQRIEAPREVVWAALNDPAVLRQCIRGCDSIQQLSPTVFQATVTLKVGAIKASFAGNVVLSNLVPPESYTISGNGSGGAAGFLHGTANVKLQADGDATILSYGAEAAIGGKLALGARLLESTAKKLAVEFFEKLDEAVVPGDACTAVPSNDAKKRGWFRSLWKPNQ